MRIFLKYLFLLVAGGLVYNVIEVLFRGWSHWTMFFLGGTCFVALGLINETTAWEMPLWKQLQICMKNLYEKRPFVQWLYKRSCMII